MALTADVILSAIAPQFNSNASRAVFLEMAKDSTTVGQFSPAKYERAVALRAAHMLQLTVTRKRGEGGAVQAMSEGQLSIQFAGASAGAGWDDLGQTHFGIQLRALIRGSVVGMGVCSGIPSGYEED